MDASRSATARSHRPCGKGTENLNTLKMLGALACLAVSISLSGCATTGVPKTSTEVVKDLQHQARAIARGRGYTGSQVFNGGSLEQRETGTLRFALQGGERYVAIGLCDKECSDIDIGVYDEQGIEIAGDRAEDAIPIVELDPEEDTTVIFRLKMLQCDLEPCAYALGVFRE